MSKTKIIGKPIRHFERCRTSSNEENFVVKHVNRTEYRKRDVYNPSLGRMISTGAIETIDRHEEMKNYRPNDFSMENLISIGAVSTLQTVKLQGSSDQFVTDVLSQLE